MTDRDTKTKILDAAEHLIAEKGFAAASLRAVTAAAGVNLAAVNYHFGSKDDLVKEIFRRRTAPVNEARIETLNRLEEGAGPLGPPLEPIVRAFVAPAVEVFTSDERDTMMRLYGRLHADRQEHLAEMFFSLFHEVFVRFSSALQRALPELPHVDVVWRLHFMIGVLVHTMADSRRVEQLTGGALRPDNTDEMIERLVAFITGGLRAPLSSETDRS